MKASTLKGLLRSSSSSSSPGTAGSSSNDSPASKVEEDYVVLVGKKNMSSEATSYGTDAELELGLGLGLSIGGRTSAAGSDAGKPKVSTCGRILTAKDFPSVVGTKRAADSVSQEGGSSPPRVSQVVGWPPIRASRMYSLVNQAKTPRSEEEKVVTGDKEKSNDFALKNKTNNVGNRNVAKEQSNLGFVKVNFDGIAIGRKVDLNAHSCYETLAQTLEAMFFQPGMTLSLNGSSGEGEKASKPSKLLDGSSEFVLTYEDNDGDWMLVGEIPWGMFLSSVKRLRIMRNSEANGLAPRSQERNDRQRIKPI